MLARRRTLIGSLEGLGIVFINHTCESKKKSLHKMVHDVFYICTLFILSLVPYDIPHNPSSLAFLLTSFLAIISLLSSLKVTYIYTHVSKFLPLFSPIQINSPKTTLTSPQTPT